MMKYKDIEHIRNSVSLIRGRDVEEQKLEISIDDCCSGGSGAASCRRKDALLHEERESAKIGQRGRFCAGVRFDLRERYLRRAAARRLLEHHVTHVVRRIVQTLPSHKAQDSAFREIIVDQTSEHKIMNCILNKYL